MVDVLNIIKNAGSVGIAGHVNPDGDCVGSTLGLYNYLKKNYPDKKVSLFLEEPQEIYSYLKGIDEIITPEKETGRDESFDVFFVLDCGSADRLGFAGKYLETSKETICVDHHVSNTGFCKYSVIEPDMSSTCELLYKIFNGEGLDIEIAKCIYTGIIHDTGVMQYSCTSPETLRVCASLMEFGFDASWIIEKSFYEKTYIQNQILGRAILESVIFMDGNCIFSALDQKIMDFYGVTGKDMDGIVSQLRYTKGIHCAVFMYEKEPMVFKVSLRSDSMIDVAKIASKFGGGGHVRAAGFTMSGTAHDIINNISGDIEKELNANSDA
ncbi:MAG: bifunctional oligoribonuclease/PAP phosphatase NrnA [Lachnospiraceae bacterium]|nr:bifunctional oligoribonuclease/PAP phosphatase NrnA [Lachnospiraceae bacterium]